MDAPLRSLFDQPPTLGSAPRAIRSVAVLGAGTMGAQLAAHCANAGVPVLLLDLDAKVASEGLNRVRDLKPPPFFSPEAELLVSLGGFETDLVRAAACDWVIEAVVERLDVKQALLARLDAVRHPATIVSSNTSGLPIAALADGRSAEFRTHWLGTHFFNPPRYLHLLEVIPTPETDPNVLASVCRFADHRLGKGVVLAKDAPNFIGNRIALYGLARVFEALASGRFTIDEIDAVTGPVLGRPKSATFRTLDIAGLDVLAHVARNLAERLPAEERGAFVLPPLIETLVSRGWTGEKAGQGFYRRQRRADGETEVLALDIARLEYRPRQRVALPSLEAVRGLDDVRERVATLFRARDRVGEFLRDTLGPTLVYTAQIAPQIAYSIDDIDRVMRWGFGWELGPFELWDAIGLETVLGAVPSAARPVVVHAVIDAGRTTFRDRPLAPAAAELQILRAAKERHRVVKRNAGASLVDLGDGVLAVEFHSKLNTIGGDTIAMLNAGVKEAARNFAALVVGNEAADFSAGANLMLLLLEAQEGNWEEIDLMIRAFQAATQALRYADVPVVVAPQGRTLGGGCEIVLHADSIQAAAETYLGLVEVGVGLIPAGGGTKELLARAGERRPSAQVDLLPYVQQAFETIGYAKVSASAADAQRLGLLRASDGISMNHERLMFDAKARALACVRAGYRRPSPRTAIPAGGEGLLASLNLGVHLAWRAGRLSDHDALIGRKLAWILAGGSLPHATAVTEQYVLDLEREAFLSLCGEKKTLERIQHTLKTGKTLRN